MRANCARLCYFVAVESNVKYPQVKLGLVSKGKFFDCLDRVRGSRGHVILLMTDLSAGDGSTVDTIDVTFFYPGDFVSCRILASLLHGR